MLTKLLPDQISEHWNIIKYALEVSLPPIAGDHPDKMNRVLTSLLSSRSDCWASYRREDNTTIFEGICITQIIYDEISHTRNLLLYCVYGYNKTEEKTWINALMILAKYAKKHKCNDIIAYSNVPYIIEKVKELGGDTSYTYIAFNLDKMV